MQGPKEHMPVAADLQIQAAGAHQGEVVGRDGHHDEG